MDLYAITERLEDLEALDPVGKSIAAAVGKIFPHGPVKDLLSGTWLGHSLHPLLTDLPIGAWTSATVLDVVGGSDTDAAADLLIGVGLLAAVPTVAAGLSDWSDTHGGEQRVGLLHAASNGAAAALYATSLWARKRGRRATGVSLALAGAAVTMVGGYLGGHLSLSLGVGVDQTALEGGVSEWTPAAREEELGDGAAKKVMVGGADVLIVRRNGAVFVLSNVCSHLGGPLDEGEVGENCVTCPWHGSTFRYYDGSVARGPARAPQPTYDVRTNEGNIEIRLRAGRGGA